MTSEVSGTAEFRGTTLRYWRRGAEGLPWLVISHGLGLDSQSFAPLAQRLQARWRVLRWDMPGHGESGPMPDGFDMAMSVDALAAVMAAAGCERAVLLGFSYGGVVSQLAAHRRPSAVDGLIVYGCFSPLLVAGPPAWTRWLAERMVLRGSWRAVRQRFADNCALREEVRRAVFDAVTRVGVTGFRTIVHALLWPGAHDPAFRIGGPVLWIRGARDSNLAALRQVEVALRATHPQLVEAIVPDAGHCAHQDNPPAFEAAVENFLAASFTAPAIGQRNLGQTAHRE